MHYYHNVFVIFGIIIMPQKKKIKNKIKYKIKIKKEISSAHTNSRRGRFLKT